MLKPVNSHVLIEPLKHEAFIASQRETYQEIGVVIATPEGYDSYPVKSFKVGDKVFFDAWLGKKYPKDGSNDEYYWLIKYDDIVAYESVSE